MKYLDVIRRVKAELEGKKAPGRDGVYEHTKNTNYPPPDAPTILPFRPFAEPQVNVPVDFVPLDFTAPDCPAFAFDGSLSVGLDDVRRTVAEVMIANAALKPPR